MAFLYPSERTSLNLSTDPVSAGILKNPSYSGFSHQTDASPAPMCLPQGIRLVNKGHQVAVVCSRSFIAKGTRFGPYQGRVVRPSQVKEGQNNEFLWEVRLVKEAICLAEMINS